MVYLGSIEFISLRKPTPSTVLIGHMSWIIYSAMDLVISSERFEGRGRDLEVSSFLLNVCCNVGCNVAGEFCLSSSGWTLDRCWLRLVVFPLYLYSALQSLHTALSFMISLGASCFIIFQNPKYFHTTDFAFPGKFVHSLLNSAAIMNLLIMKSY